MSPPPPAHAHAHRCVVVEEVPAFAAWELAASFDEDSHGPWLAVLEAPDMAPELTSELGRWAYVCAEPSWVFASKRGAARAGPPGAEQPLTGAPLDELAATLARFRGAASTLEQRGPSSDLPPFRGGAVGYLGYELLYQIEAVPDRGRDDLALPDLRLMWCELVYAVDLRDARGFVCATGFGASAPAARATAETRLRSGLARVAELRERPRPGQRAPGDPQLLARASHKRAALPRLRLADLEARGVHPTLARADYLRSIETIKEAILSGQVFEVCLTQRFDVADTVALDGAALYAILRAVNPAPMGAYLRTPEAEVLSASPERFLSLDRAGVVETRPIKGTRARGRDPEEDRALAEDLRTAEKDRAENLMIVDLCRNDLGKVARFGSVRVTELCGVHPYAFTWQMVSTVTAQLREGLGPVDLLRACFPGGSMTGAPKIEAMKIIDALEPTKRGVFSGAIGYIDFDGALDLSIVIRTLIRRRRGGASGPQLSFHVGGAIVADSDPEAEYQETLDKAHGLVLAIELAREDARAEDGGPP